MKYLHKKSLPVILFISLFAINFFSLIGADIVVLITPYLKIIGANNTYTGIFTNIPSIILVLFFIIGGRFIKAKNSKGLIGLSYIISAISLVAKFFVKDHLPMLMILRIFSSLSFGIGFTLLFNILHSFAPDNRRNGIIAIYGLSGISAFPISSWINEYIITHHPHHSHILFLIASAALVIAYLLLLTIPDPNKDNNHDDKGLNVLSLLKRKDMLTLLLINIVFGGVFGVISSFLPNLATYTFKIPSYSVFFTAFALTSIVIRILIFNILDKLNRSILNITSLSFISLSLITIIFVKSQLHLIIAGLLYGIGHSIIFPTLSSSYVAKGNETQRGVLTSGYIVFNTFGIIFFASILGAVGDVTNLLTVFLITAIISIAAILCGILDYKNIN